MNTETLSSSRKDAGFTLMELVLVLVLAGFISVLVATKSGSITQWQQRAELRRLANTWEYLFREAVSKGENYRLLVNIDSSSYAVRREVYEEGASGKLRSGESFLTSRERKRRQSEDIQAEGKARELDEYAQEDLRQSKPLDELYWDYVFSHDSSSVRLATPLENPSLAEEQKLTAGVRIIDVKDVSGVHEEGLISIRLSSHGASTFAIIHLGLDEQVLSMSLDPASGEVLISTGYQDFGGLGVGKT